MTTNDQMIVHIEKLEFVTEVVNDWAANPNLIENLTEKTIVRMFSGMADILDQTTGALRDIAEHGPEHREATTS